MFHNQKDQLHVLVVQLALQVSRVGSTAEIKMSSNSHQDEDDVM